MSRCGSNGNGDSVVSSGPKHGSNRLRASALSWRRSIRPAGRRFYAIGVWVGALVTRPPAQSTTLDRQIDRLRVTVEEGSHALVDVWRWVSDDEARPLRTSLDTHAKHRPNLDVV